MEGPRTKDERGKGDNTQEPGTKNKKEHPLGMLPLI